MKKKLQKKRLLIGKNLKKVFKKQKKKLMKDKKEVIIIKNIQKDK